MSPNPPSGTINWGIVGAGMISSWFVTDICRPRPDTSIRHVVAAVGSSSISKGETFVEKNVPAPAKPAVYDNYAAVYADPNVDIVYIGTPHAFHRQNCLDAIAAGKHVLCEKPFTINAREAEEVLAAAREKGVFVMEAMWTRFHPLVRKLKEVLYTEKAIGDVKRTFCDFGLDMKISSLGEDSRLKNRELGAGSLLDIGIYSLLWGLLSLEADEAEGEDLEVKAVQSLSAGVDVATSMVVKYPKTGRMGVLTSTLEAQSEPQFCRIEGSEGFVVVEGLAASAPRKFTIHPKIDEGSKGGVNGNVNGLHAPREYKFEHEGMGFQFEADAVGLDVVAGRKENAIMPHRETLRVMRIMDDVRRQGGASFPQDEV